MTTPNPIIRSYLYLAEALETRPTVQAIFQLRFLAGDALSGGMTAAVVPGSLTWLSATASVYLFNGVADVREDRFNGSSRPIASGQLSPRTGRNLAVGLGVSALTGAAVQSPALLILTAVLLGLGYAYSATRWALKRWTWGVALVGILSSAATYGAGAVISGRLEPAVVVFGALLGGWMAVVGALTKDLPDAAGDRAATVALTVGGTAVAGLALHRGSYGSRDRCRRPYRGFMITQYSAHALVLLAL
ncbi:UbiA family prenyltransferase [Actinoplanes sp. NEAU-A12]|uniref:UbiA family prenyltransferase n=1 Tax=Actinoplanes sandaracinus TaxID=3045177 RepID=A0ABT6WHS7_9ACTN|nr:UbiA family prenyltransferase [Actinoplanes sandaracinus]MDI6099271.1 UbiA family prenyltransferase [Actinoplanes sandaracinus]